MEVTRNQVSSETVRELVSFVQNLEHAQIKEFNSQSPLFDVAYVQGSCPGPKGQSCHNLAYCIQSIKIAQYPTIETNFCHCGKGKGLFGDGCFEEEPGILFFSRSKEYWKNGFIPLAIFLVLVSAAVALVAGYVLGRKSKLSKSGKLAQIKKSGSNKNLYSPVNSNTTTYGTIKKSPLDTPKIETSPAPKQVTVARAETYHAGMSSASNPVSPNFGTKKFKRGTTHSVEVSTPSHNVIGVGMARDGSAKSVGINNSLTPVKCGNRFRAVTPTKFQASKSENFSRASVSNGESTELLRPKEIVFSRHSTGMLAASSAIDIDTQS